MYVGCGLHIEYSFLGGREGCRGQRSNGDPLKDGPTPKPMASDRITTSRNSRFKKMDRHRPKLNTSQRDWASTVAWFGPVWCYGSVHMTVRCRPLLKNRYFHYAGFLGAKILAVSDGPADLKQSDAQHRPINDCKGILSAKELISPISRELFRALAAFVRVAEFRIFRPVLKQTIVFSPFLHFTVPEKLML